jgi:hypothetical protein
MFSLLGNGFTEAQVDKDTARLATYVRSDDTELEIYYVFEVIDVSIISNTI